jgi:hypothetical protein
MCAGLFGDRGSLSLCRGAERLRVFSRLDVCWLEQFGWRSEIHADHRPCFGIGIDRGAHRRRSDAHFIEAGVG